MKFPIKIKATKISYGSWFCELIAGRILYIPGDSCSSYYVNRREVRLAFKREVGLVIYSKQGFGLERPTKNTFRIGCCTFGPKATRLLRRWANRKTR